jgi:hypothetical protein
MGGTFSPLTHRVPTQPVNLEFRKRANAGELQELTMQSVTVTQQFPQV